MAYKKTILNSASEDRLEKLIQERLVVGADKEMIDKRIWDLFGEEWCVMFTDLSGFSRQVAKFGIIHFLQTIYEAQRILIPILEDHDGILLKIEGDSFLVIFRNPSKAIHASIAMNLALKKYNETRDPEDQVLLCVGLGHGQMLRIGDQDVFGEEVNSASKLGEDVAKAGDIFVTSNVKTAITELMDLQFQELTDLPAGVKSAYKIIY